MNELELMVFVFFAVNAIITITLTMILDRRITKLESALRASKWRKIGRGMYMEDAS